MDRTRVIYRQDKTLIVAWVPEGGGDLQMHVECADDLALLEGIADLLADLEAVVGTVMAEVGKAK